MPIPAPKIPSLGFIQKRVKGTHMMIHPTLPRWAFVNDFGYRILQLLDDQRTLSDITEILLKEYDVERDRLSRDIAHFLDSFDKIGMFQKDGIANDKTVLKLKSLFVHLTSKCNPRLILQSKTLQVRKEEQYSTIPVLPLYSRKLKRQQVQPVQSRQSPVSSRRVSILLAGRGKSQP